MIYQDGRWTDNNETASVKMQKPVILRLLSDRIALVAVSKRFFLCTY